MSFHMQNAPVSTDDSDAIFKYLTACVEKIDCAASRASRPSLYTSNIVTSFTLLPSETSSDNTKRTQCLQLQILYLTVHDRRILLSTVTDEQNVLN